MAEQGPELESRDAIHSMDVDSDAVAEPQRQSPTSNEKGNSKPTTLRALIAKDEDDIEHRDLIGESPPGAEISVILFGRTGSGKSTLAQMLTAGKLEAGSLDFAASSGIRGRTKELQTGVGRGWRVVDTPGFGEPKDPQSTISSEEAERKIKKYITMIQGTYTHFLYTVMRDRIDQLDKKLWKFFVRLFGDSVGSNFSVVISNASVGWVEQNWEELAANFKGCDSFLSAEFPPIRRDDEEWESELAEIRAASLKQLEVELAKLGRAPVECAVWGGFFRTTASLLMGAADRASSGISGLFRRVLSGLTENGRCVLEPNLPPSQSSS